MRSPERRFTWALLAGGIVTGFTAPHTDAPFYNFLIGLSWGVPAWIGTWGVLELLSYMQDSRDHSGAFKSDRKNNVHIMPGRER